MSTSQVDVVDDRLVDIGSYGGASDHPMGLLVGDRLVLTSSDACPEGGYAEVRPLNSDVWFASTRVWPSAGNSAALVVLLEITDPRWKSSTRPSRWGALVRQDYWVDAVIRGGADSPIRLNHLSRVNGRSTLRPALSTDADRPDIDWPASGAPVFCGDMLTGVLVHDQGNGDVPPQVMPVADLAADADFRHLTERATGRPLRVEPVGLDGVLRPWFPSAVPRFPAALLRAEYEMVPFHGRDGILDRLKDWALSPALLSGLVLTGADGQGKRRLARHLADDLRLRGWAVGELSTEPRADWLDAIAQMRTPLLLIVDSDSRRREQLRALAAHLTRTGCGAAARVLLLAVDGITWWTTLPDSSPELSGMFDCAPEIVADLEPTQDGRIREVRLAAEAFARTGLPGLSGEADNQLHRAVRDLADAPTLNLHATALAAALRGTNGMDGPFDVLLEHEIREWERAAAELSETAWSCWRDAMTVALLFGAANESVALTTLRLVPKLRDHSASPAREELAAWIRRLYPPWEPGHYWGRMDPPVLLRTYVAQACADPGLLESMLPSVDGHQVRNALTVLLASGGAALHDRLRGLIVTHPQDLLPEVAALAIGVPGAAELTESIVTAQDAELTDDVCRAVLTRIPTSCGVLVGVRMRLHNRLVDNYQAEVDAGADRARPALAAQLIACARAYADGGDGLAVDLIGRAVDHYRWLVESPQTTSAAFVVQLADGLCLQGTLLAEHGRLPEAVDAAVHAAALYRDLAAVDVRLNTRRVAALELLASWCLRTAEHGRAAQALQEASDVYRSLAAAAGTAGVADQALDRLSVVLGDLAAAYSISGAPDAALATRREAIAVLRQLSLVRPDRYRRRLLAALHALYDAESMLGGQESALATLRQAAAVWRQEAEDHPGRGLAHLAAVMRTLSEHLSAAGQEHAALDAAQEAVDHLRRSPYRRPFDVSSLASAEHTLGLRLAALGRWDDAAEVTAEAVGRYDGLVAAGQDEHVTPLAAALINHSAAFEAVDRHAEAHTAAQRAFAVLAERDMAHTHASMAVAALTNAAVALRGLRRYAEGLEAARNAVDLQRSTNAELSEEEVSRLLSLLCELLEIQGLSVEARPIAEDVVTIRGRMAQRHPGAYRKHYAFALHQLARCLAAERRWQDSLRFVQQAIAEQLATADGQVDNERAAATLLLCRCLVEQGRSGEAISAAYQAVEAYRRLARDGSPRDLARLAHVLDTICGLLDPVLDPKASLTFAEEIVSLRRVLGYRGDPVQLGQLATALRALARRREADGQQQGAYGAAWEAAIVSRRLQELGAGNGRHEIAESLRLQAGLLDTMGRLQESIGTTTDAVVEYRALSAVEPETYQRQLGGTLLDLSTRLMRLNDYLAGILSAQEAVQALDLITPASTTDRAMLGAALVQLGVGLSAVGREDERLPAVERAVDIYAELAREEHGFTDHHARALRSFSDVRARRASSSARRSAAAQAVDIHRRLAGQDSGYNSELAASLRAYAAVLPRTRWRQARGLRREADALLPLHAPADNGAQPVLAKGAPDAE